MMENFDVINNYPNYGIRRSGEVKNLKTGRILKPRVNRRGYGRVTLYNSEGSKDVAIHKLIAEQFCDGYQNGYDVNHKDGVKTNNYADNLEWCTRSDNIKHAYEIGLKRPSGPHPIKRIEIIETGEQYESIRECARCIDGDFRHIRECLKGTRQTHKGYHYKYL